jgi:hypothetical protein
VSIDPYRPEKNLFFCEIRERNVSCHLAIANNQKLGLLNSRNYFAVGVHLQDKMPGKNCDDCFPSNTSVYTERPARGIIYNLAMP